METVAERLAWAIEEYGPRPRGRPGAKGSIRGFHSKMSKRTELMGLGSSYGMIHRYLRGDTVPPAVFLHAAAQVLAPIREAWLRSGEGERTEQEQAAADRQRPNKEDDRIRAALRAEGGPDYNDLHYANRQLFLHTMVLRAAQRSRESGVGGPVGEENMVAAWRELLDLLRFPFRRMGRSRASAEAVSRWQTAAMHAFDLAMQMEPALNAREDDDDVHLDAERMPKER